MGLKYRKDTAGPVRISGYLNNGTDPGEDEASQEPGRKYAPLKARAGRARYLWGAERRISGLSAMKMSAPCRPITKLDVQKLLIASVFQSREAAGSFKYFYRWSSIHGLSSPGIEPLNRCQSYFHQRYVVPCGSPALSCIFPS